MARDDRSGEVTGVVGFFICITTLLVMLRCYCKLVIVKNFSADDYFSVLSLASFLVFCSLSLLSISNGTGKRRYLIPDQTYPFGMKWWWVCEPLYIITNIPLKFSIGIFLLRIAHERAHRIILWTSLVAIQVYSIFFFFLFIFQCWPVSFFWDRFRGGKGHCIPPKVTVTSLYGYSAISCITDWTFSLVPIFIVRNLQMDTRNKVTVGIILACCAIGSSATIVRIPFINSLNDTADFLYSTTDLAIWAICETGIGLATSAAATLRPLLRQVLKDTSTNDSTSRKRSHAWTSSYPSRAGYQEHSSQHGDHNMQLTNHSSKHHDIEVMGAGGSSPSGSTIGLKDWEQGNKIGLAGERAFSNKGITKTVQITQL